MWKEPREPYLQSAPVVSCSQQTINFMKTYNTPYAAYMHIQIYKLHRSSYSQATKTQKSSEVFSGSYHLFLWRLPGS